MDVNHGFAIYAADGRIVTQTQAMPGFVNRLVYRLLEPGRYRVLCLEYCGLAHHGMTANSKSPPPREVNHERAHLEGGGRGGGKR